MYNSNSYKEIKSAFPWIINIVNYQSIILAHRPVAYLIAAYINYGQIDPVNQGMFSVIWNIF